MGVAILDQVANVKNETTPQVDPKDPAAAAAADPSKPGSDLRLEQTLRHYRYIEILESNFAAGRLAYFDPGSEQSIAGLQQKIRDLAPITREQFDFSATNDARRQFDQDLAAVIGPLDAILSAHLDSIRIPDSVLDVCITTIQNRIEWWERSRKALDSPDTPANAEELRKISDAHNLAVSEEFRKREQELTAKIEKLEKEIKVIEEKTEVVFDRQWDLREGVVHSQRFTYDGGIPYFKIDEHISKGTTRIDHNIVKPAFDVTYTFPVAKWILSGWWQSVRGEVEKATVGQNNIAWKLVPGAIGAVTGAAKGFAQAFFGEPACAGRVQLIAHAADKPATKLVLQQKRDQLKDALARREQVRADLKTAREHEHDDQKVKIDDALSLYRKRAQTLADAKKFREVAVGQYSAYEQEIPKYGDLVLKLPSHGDAVCDQFASHWKESKAVEALPFDSNDEKKVNEVVDAIGDTTRDRKAEFKAYHLLDLPAQKGK
jgi:hypothetical protein